MANFVFYGERKQATTEVYFAFWSWIWSLAFKFKRVTRTCDKVSKWTNRVKDWENANSFLSDIFVAVASLGLKVPKASKSLQPQPFPGFQIVKTLLREISRKNSEGWGRECLPLPHFAFVFFPPFSLTFRRTTLSEHLEQAIATTGIPTKHNPRQTHVGVSSFGLLYLCPDVCNLVFEKQIYVCMACY